MGGFVEWLWRVLTMMIPRPMSKDTFDEEPRYY
jgi:hypothetical protein